MESLGQRRIALVGIRAKLLQPQWAQAIDTPALSHEPAINIAAQDHCRPRHKELELPRRLGSKQHGPRAGDAVLPIGGHDGLPVATTLVGISDSPAMLFKEPRASLGIAPGRCGKGRHHDMNGVVVINAQHTEAKPTAQITVAHILLPPLARAGKPRGEPNLVARRCTVDGLEKQFEIERQLHLADHEEGRLHTPDTYQVTAIDLPFDNKAQPFHEAFEGQVEVALGHDCSNGGDSYPLIAEPLSLMKPASRLIVFSICS